MTTLPVPGSLRPSVQRSSASSSGQRAADRMASREGRSTSQGLLGRSGTASLLALTWMLTAGLMLELVWALQRPLAVLGAPLWPWLQTGLLLCVLGLWTQTRRLTLHQGRDATLAHSDELTGLPGRRALNEQLQALLGGREQALMGRGPGKQVWSALLIDIDHLGAINGAHGHLAGDAVLRAVTLALRQELRGDDVLGRWGGEEFLALLPGTDFEGAMVAAERLRRAVALRTFPYVGTVTVSIGVASWLPGDTLERLVARADAGMYAAKRSGRNRVAFKH